MIHGMNHFIITAEDRVKTRDYYCGLLGPTGRASPRPGLPGCVGLRRRRGRLMPTRSVVASACPPARCCARRRWHPSRMNWPNRAKSRGAARMQQPLTSRPVPLSNQVAFCSMPAGNPPHRAIRRVT